jgi:hypothetical protein
MLMLHKFSLVESVEVTIESLSYDWIHNWFACQGTAIKLETLIHLLVSGLKLELLGLIVSNS